MSRIPDYEEMRLMLCEREAENMDGNDIVNILYRGFDGYKYASDQNIIDIFVQMYGPKHIPKKPLTKEEMNKMALENEDKRIERGDPR